MPCLTEEQIFPLLLKVAHSVWSNNGFLSVSNFDNPLLSIGSIDFAGSGVVHTTGESQNSLNMTAFTFGWNVWFSLLRIFRWSHSFAGHFDPRTATWKIL